MRVYNDMNSYYEEDLSFKKPLHRRVAYPNKANSEIKFISVIMHLQIIMQL